MVRLIATGIGLVIAGTVSAAGASGPELFGAANRAFQAQEWQEVVDRVDELFAMAEALPIGERAQLVPPALFFRASAEAMLGKDHDASRDFRLYHLYAPTAAPDAARFPKKVVKAFENALRAREDLAAELAAFRALPETTALTGPVLAASPLRLVLAAEPLARLASAADPAQAEAVMAEILVGVRGGSDDVHETVDAIQDRIAFADLAFGAAGSTTDRATVLVLLGPPSQLRFPMVKDNQAAASHVNQAASMRNSLQSEGIETWIYRADRAPKFFDAKSVDLSFQIDRSRGTWTLEKMFPAPVVIEGAAKVLRETGRLAG